MRDEAAEPRLPVLAGGDVMAVEERREAHKLEACDQLLSEFGRVPARIGDEDLELFASADVGHGCS